jgi:peptide deformylase
MDPRKLTYSLLMTMADRGGVGLASNQVGIKLRVFAMGSGNVAYSVFNPEVIESDSPIVFGEGCLSSPGLFLDIKRPDHIKVRFTDMYGQQQDKEFSGLTSRIFQHELDHLNGVVYTSLVHPHHLDKAKRHVKSNLKKLEAQRQASLKQQAIAAATQKIVKQSKQQTSTVVQSADKFVINTTDVVG